MSIEAKFRLSFNVTSKLFQKFFVSFWKFYLNFLKSLLNYEFFQIFGLSQNFSFSCCLATHMFDKIIWKISCLNTEFYILHIHRRVIQ